MKKVIHATIFWVKSIKNRKGEAYLDTGIFS